MFTRAHTATPSLRFKNWSRKSYAAFYSIGKHVTIGNLKSVVADTFLRKQQNTISIDNEAPAIQMEIEAERQDPPEEEQLLFSGKLSIISIVNKSAKNGGLVSLYLHFLYWADSMYSYRPFLF